MKTNLKLFRENLKAIKAKDSPYVRAGRENYLKFLKVCMCTESFNQDGLTIEKGCIYGITNIDGYPVLYELTGRWENIGHNGEFLSIGANREGIKAWNIYRKFSDNFKEIKLSAIYDFLYKEE